MSDSISDILTRIRNAQTVRKPSVQIPYSTLLWNFTKVLEREGYIKNVIKRGRKVKRTIEAEVVYDGANLPVIQGLRRVSRPGRRVYQKTRALHPVKNNLGIAIVSTSKGLMTNKEAKKAGLGGEVMCEIW